MKQRKLWVWSLIFSCMIGMLVSLSAATSNDPLALWPQSPPDETLTLGAEYDTTTEDSNLVAGKRVMRLGNVSQPTITLYRPQPHLDTGVSILICPGGGHHILAWDLEGTEVADWLNRIGVTGIVLKYRVPARDPNVRWKSAVQDAQRAMRLIRSKAAEWRLDPDRMGILGFSAGGQTAVMTSVLHQTSQYLAMDEFDTLSARPDFSILIYPAWLVDESGSSLRPDIQIDASTPPMFFAHAMDDPVTPKNSMIMGAALQEAGVSSEVHLYDGGGHGFGLRPSRFPCTTWPDAAEKWMRYRGILPD